MEVCAFFITLTPLFVPSALQAVEEAAAGKLTDADKQLVKDKCASAMSWLDANTLAEKEEYEHKLKELENVCRPVMTKMHGGAPSGGAQPTSSAGGKGPTVEEVD